MTHWSWLSFWWGVAACWIGFTSVPLLLLAARALIERHQRQHTIEKMLSVGSRQ